MLAHISDIHFRKADLATKVYTADDDLRREMQHALGEIADELGAMHGILITGDIAFAAQQEEYENAHTWIRAVCRRTGCPEESVRAITGNHDVLRGALTESTLLQTAHAELRRHGCSQKYDTIDTYINGLLADKAAPEVLFSPLRHYNDFADKFLSGFHASQPFWEQTIVMNDRSKLRIRGLNSALISGANDNLGDNKLVLGPMFSYLPREEGVEYLLMCHHPPQWLWDQDRIDDFFNTRSRVVLFGHKHVQRIYKHIAGNGHEVLRIHAGALNPDPGEPQYEPRFNCLKLSVEKKEGARRLNVELHRRVWNSEDTKFVPAGDSGGACQMFHLALPDWDDREVATETLLAPGVVSEALTTVSDPLSVISDDANKARLLSAPRRLAYRFMALPYHLRIEVAQSLKLLLDEDKGQSDTELFRRFFRRATERSDLAALWRETEIRHSDGKPDENPFNQG